jgi:PsbP-like protein
MRRLWLPALALIASLTLAACGGGSAAQAPTAEPQPTARPTSTPRPEPTKKPTAEPTEEPTAEPIEEPTAESGSQVTRKIDMTDLQTYSYKTGIFSIDAPSSWTPDDRSSATEVLVRFTDVSENGVLLVDLFEEPKNQTEEQLTKLLNDYLDRTYTKQPKFSRDEPKAQSDGSVLVVWGYDVDLNGKTIRLLGNSFVEQRDNLISVLTIALPDEQFDGLREPINSILNSYKIDSSVGVTAESSPTAETTASGQLQKVEIGDLETYSYETGLFSIDVPTNWSLKDNSKSGEAILVWTDPSQNGLIVVDLFASQDKRSSDELVKLLQNFLNNSFSSEPDFSMDDPKEQSDGSQLIVWSYTANASGGVKAKLLGNSFIEQRGDKISILTTSVPEEQFDTLKPDTDKIINSYKIDDTAALP